MVHQVKNSNGTFSYFFNGKCVRKSTKHDYNFYVIATGSFSTKYQTAIAHVNYWQKYGNEDMQKRDYTILTIQK